MLMVRLQWNPTRQKHLLEWRPLSFDTYGKFQRA
jgi:hypothetical protein